MQPPMFPKNIESFEGSSFGSPFFIIVSTVGEVTASAFPNGASFVNGAVNRVMYVGHDAIKNARAASAGFKKFCPQAPRKTLLL